MTAESVEVGIESLYVDGHVRGTLSTVNQHGNVMVVGDADDVGDGVDGAEHVAHMCDGDETGAGREEAFQRFKIQASLVCDGTYAKADAASLPLELPGYDVGVVFHLGDDDFITCFHASLRKGGGDEVDAFCSASCEDDLGGAAGVDVAPYGFASLFVQVGGLLTEEVDAAMYVGVHVQVFVCHGIDDATWLLRGGGVVQIDERVAIDLAAEDGEVRTGRRSPRPPL